MVIRQKVSTHKNSGTTFHNNFVGIFVFEFVAHDNI